MSLDNLEESWHHRIEKQCRVHLHVSDSFILETYTAPLQDTTTQRRSNR